MISWQARGPPRLGLEKERYALAADPFLGHDSVVPTAEDEESWLQQLRDSEDNERMDPAWRGWLHALYLKEGPLSRERVWPMAKAELVRRAQEAGTLVGADVWATLGQSAEVTAGVHFDRVRVVVNGEVASGSGLMSFDPTELLVEVADAAQEIIMDDFMVWPQCPQHDAGLHPELVDGEAVWVCRVGRHTLARIGRLGATVPQSAKAAKRLERRKKRS